MAAKNGKNTIEILGIRDILQKKLFIPYYQRPYKWSAASVSELVSDIKEAAESAEKFKDYRYRIGTVILHRTKREGEECFGIIDGQQRLVSLMLIELALDGLYLSALRRKLQGKSQQGKHKEKLFCRL